MTAGPGLRWARGALLAAAVVGVSASAHAWAGGGWPPGTLALVAWLILSSVFAAALGREAGLVRIAGLQVAGQVGLHCLLAMSHAGHGSATSLAQPAGGHLHSGALAGGAHPSGSLADSLLAGGWAMLLAHLAAAAMLSGWLLAGERAVWSLLGGLAAAGSAAWSRTVALASHALQGLPAEFGGPVPVPAGFGPLPAWRAGAVLRVAPRRGPPAPAAA